ncbi:secreted protein [methanotrophic bacterial endosymbiont of Bathymodiolus sp.]|nr:secreted protein [methanotrophic bacterial endosymbiont of Bathymodiolus sp.]
MIIKTSTRVSLLKYNSLITGSIFSILLLTAPVFATESNKHHAMSHGAEQANFDPGDSYLHRMSVNPSDYKKLKI